ncbi:hypothetical protein HG531_004501 [Fusarium graminearum]|nr:hypothetical protein HG531_004501 [Fusarium graminearum]
MLWGFGLARGGENNDTTGTKIERGTDSGHGAGLDSADGALDESAHLLEVRDIGDGVLSLETGLVHLLDGLGGVATLGRLTGKHDTVGTVSNGVTDIADFGTGGAGVLDHGLEHLSGADDRLAGKVAHGNELLLGSENLSSGDLNTEITTGHHDTVCGLENLAEVVETLSVLDLGDDLDALALLAEDVTDVIGLVLLGKGRQIDIGVGQVDTLLGADSTVVAGLDKDSLLVNDLENIKSKDTIVDVDDTAGLNDIGNVLVVDVPERVSREEIRHYWATNMFLSSDLGTLGVEGNGDVAASVGGLGLTSMVNDGLVTGISELVDGLDRVGLGANGADDGRAAVVALRSESGVEGSKP